MIHKKKILVVDADPKSELTLKSLFQTKNFTPLFVPDAQTGLRLALEWRPHLILLDLVLPQMSGLGFLREIKRLTQNNPIPVVVLTEVEDLEVVYEALELGAVGYINKSDDTRELCALMRESVIHHQKIMPQKLKLDLNLH